jgi:translation elongation factor EF-G
MKKMDKLNLCKYINDEIKQLNKNEIEEIFKLIHDNNVTYTKNSNGIFVNLSWIDIDILYKIEKYIIFCINSHIENKKHEILKNELSSNITTNNTINNNIDENYENNKNIDDNIITIKKVNSNMRFYLAKKKLLFKPSNIILDDVLIPEKNI